MEQEALEGHEIETWLCHPATGKLSLLTLETDRVSSFGIDK